MAAASLCLISMTINDVDQMAHFAKIIFYLYYARWQTICLRRISWPLTSMVNVASKNWLFASTGKRTLENFTMKIGFKNIKQFLISLTITKKNHYVTVEEYNYLLSDVHMYTFRCCLVYSSIRLRCVSHSACKISVWQQNSTSLPSL